MGKFRNSIVFRYTLLYVALFIVAEVIVFSVLWWSTLTLYEKRANRMIHEEAAALEQILIGLSVAEMVLIINERCNDEPGEHDEYILASREGSYIAGNVLEWPAGANVDDVLLDLALGRQTDGVFDLHRVRTMTLPTGHRVLVGRNLTELMRLRGLMRRALVRTVALTLVLGLAAGYTVSRVVARRLEAINLSSIAILVGDISRRMPVSGKGDELDLLARNLNRMLDRIEELMRSMSEVTDNIAHDMRKPISRLRSRIELALMGPRDAALYHEALTRTIEETDELLAMFNALLTIAVAESGTQRDQFEEIDLAEIATSTVEIYEPAAEDAGLQIELDAPRPIKMRGNPHLLTQALANLLDNAIKHAAGSGALRVLAYEERGRAKLSVADRGPGIPESFREHALDRFSRADESRTTPGSGLGLSLVRAVAYLHQGNIVLADNAPGLVVTLNLPRLPDQG